ncbi:hypothetical protein ES288_D04G105000v1 [Gossypium darwinii]|uniref:Uncharacterized protein n=1 Tax=Gossypium darwinii TaxID=34276 RepID=A0A5D2CYY6_GOSDA|nr:hypothetical protein ES288_D04G105000v1 [Gossypium darwinii]
MAHSLVSRLKQFEAPSSSDLDGANRAPSSPPRSRNRKKNVQRPWKGGSACVEGLVSAFSGADCSKNP